jgi:glycosyltransferase involved in cell wall biosynthesis
VCGSSRRSTTSARSARRRRSCARGGCARTAWAASRSRRGPGCYRSSRVATLPIAVKNALHSAIGTWSTAVDTYITPSEFARSRYLKAGWPADRIVVKFNTAPDPGTPRPAYDGGFICLSRLAPEKGVDVLLEAWAQAFPDGGQCGSWSAR